MGIIGYALLYYKPSRTQLLKIEGAHQAGLKRALGVPVQTSTAQVHSEVHSHPVAVTTNIRVKGQLERLRLTGPGRRALNRVEASSTTTAASHRGPIRDLLEHLCDNPQLQSL